MSLLGWLLLVALGLVAGLLWTALEIWWAGHR